MKFFTFSLFLFFITTNVYTQNIVLKVLGKSNYVEYAESNGIIISFNINKKENKKRKLIDTISSLGLKNTLTSVNKKKVSLNKKKYRIEENNLEVFDELLMICINLKIKIEKVYYKIPAHKFENEDKNAILALNNATSQAKIIANNLKYKIVKILNIDDETTYADSFYDTIDLESESGKTLIRILKLLSGSNNLSSIESKVPTRNGGYNIWVTYELKSL